MEEKYPKIDEKLENLSPLGVDMDGNLLVKSEDWLWLQETVEKQQEQIEELIGSPFKIIEQQQEIERYKRALELIIENTVSGHVEHIAKRALGTLHHQ